MLTSHPGLQIELGDYSSQMSSSVGHEYRADSSGLELMNHVRHRVFQLNDDGWAHVQASEVDEAQSMLCMGLGAIVDTSGQGFGHQLHHAVEGQGPRQPIFISEHRHASDPPIDHDCETIGDGMFVAHGVHSPRHLRLDGAGPGLRMAYGSQENVPLGEDAVKALSVHHACAGEVRIVHLRDGLRDGRGGRHSYMSAQIEVGDRRVGQCLGDRHFGVPSLTRNIGGCRVIRQVRTLPDPPSRSEILGGAP